MRVRIPTLALFDLWSRSQDGKAPVLQVGDRGFGRGIDGLLNNPTIKLYTVYYAAFVLSKWFGEQGKPGKVRSGDMGDFFHAVQASAADIFVAQDARLERWLKKVAVDGLRVMNFDEFLDEFVKT